MYVIVTLYILSKNNLISSSMASPYFEYTSPYIQDYCEKILKIKITRTKVTVNNA